MPIVESGALNHLRELLSLRECSEIQCHAAGTVRNLAAEDQCLVEHTIHIHIYLYLYIVHDALDMHIHVYIIYVINYYHLLRYMYGS